MTLTVVEKIEVKSPRPDHPFFDSALYVNGKIVNHQAIIDEYYKSPRPQFGEVPAKVWAAMRVEKLNDLQKRISAAVDFIYHSAIESINNEELLTAREDHLAPHFWVIEAIMQELKDHE